MLKKYKILLSAYACEPNEGSEQGVGWNYAMEIATRGHDTWVLTRKNNQSVIEIFFLINPKINNLHFLYFDLPKWLAFWKKGARGVQIYYFLWQFFAFFSYYRKFKSLNFDLIHHITFSTIRHPSYMGLLRKPFFIGPLGGGEYMPNAIFLNLKIKALLKELIRWLSNVSIYFNPLMYITFNSAVLIFCTTTETKNAIPKIFKKKVVLSQAIGVETINDITQIQTFNLLYIGRLEAWKGVHLALKSFNLFKHSTEEKCNFTLVGSGGDYYDEIKKIIDNDSLNINWKNHWIKSHLELKKTYIENNVFIFISLHEAGGMVILEAMSYGLPVICLDLGGPGQIVNEKCGRVISTKGKSEDELIQSIFYAIMELQQNPELLKELSAGAIKRANEFTWEKTVARVYEPIENYMKKRAF